MKGSYGGGLVVFAVVGLLIWLILPFMIPDELKVELKETLKEQAEEIEEQRNDCSYVGTISDFEHTPANMFHSILGFPELACNYYFYLEDSKLKVNCHEFRSKHEVIQTGKELWFCDYDSKYLVVSVVKLT